MSPIRDSLLNLSPQASDLPLVATNVMGQEVDLGVEGPARAKGYALRVDLAFEHGWSGKALALQVVLHGASSSGVASSDTTIKDLGAYSFRDDWSGTTGVKQFLVPVHIPSNVRYIRCEYALTVGAASDSPSWSMVETSLVENVGQLWTRQSNKWL